MAGAPEPNKLLDSQQVLRFMALERKEKITPDKTHDKKFALIALGVIAAVVLALCVPVLIANLFV